MVVHFLPGYTAMITYAAHLTCSRSLAFLDDFLYEKYRFLSEGLIDLCQLYEPYVASAYSPTDCMHCLVLFCLFYFIFFPAANNVKDISLYFCMPISSYNRD